MNTIKNILNRIKNFALRHKFLTIGGVLVLAVIAFFAFRPSPPAQFEYTTVKSSALRTSVEGSGSVSTQSQVNLKSNVSGKIMEVYAKSGQQVKQGQAILRVDGTVAYQSVQKATLALQRAQLALEKLAKPAGTLEILEAENALAKAKESKLTAEADIVKAYDDGFNTIANAFLDLPEVMAGLEDTFFDNTIDSSSGGGDNITWYVNQTDYQTDAREKGIRYRDDVYNAYNNARSVYTKAFDAYKAASRTSDTQTIEALIQQTYDTTKTIADTIKISNNYIDFVQDDMERRDLTIPAMVLTHQANLDTYTADTNKHLLALLDIKDTIRTSGDTIVNSDRTIAEKTEKLKDLKEGTDILDIRTAELDVQEKQNALNEAQIELGKYTITAPFAGTIGSVEVIKYDWLSNNATVATLSTNKNIAEISLNEVDVTNIKIGQKAELTFDALPDLTLVGAVSEIDSVGIETSNVVTFKVKVIFEEEDARIRPGMGVTANVITSEKENVLLVPNGSIKNEGGQNYVEVRNLSTSKNDRVNVMLGASNDTDTEITAGLTAGQEVVVREISDAPAAEGGGGGFGPPGI